MKTFETQRNGGNGGISGPQYITIPPVPPCLRVSGFSAAHPHYLGADCWLIADCFTLNCTLFTTCPSRPSYPLRYRGAKDWSWLRQLTSETSIVKVPSEKLAAVVRAATSLPQTRGHASSTASSGGRARSKSCMI